MRIVGNLIGVKEHLHRVQRDSIFSHPLYSNLVNLPEVPRRLARKDLSDKLFSIFPSAVHAYTKPGDPYR